MKRSKAMDEVGLDMAMSALMEAGLTENEAEDMLLEYDYLFED